MSQSSISILPFTLIYPINIIIQYYFSLSKISTFISNYNHHRNHRRHRHHHKYCHHHRHRHCHHHRSSHHYCHCPDRHYHFHCYGILDLLLDLLLHLHLLLLLHHRYSHQPCDLNLHFLRLRHTLENRDPRRRFHCLDYHHTYVGGCTEQSHFQNHSMYFHYHSCNNTIRYCWNLKYGIRQNHALFK